MTRVACILADSGIFRFLVQLKYVTHVSTLPTPTRHPHKQATHLYHTTHAGALPMPPHLRASHKSTSPTPATLARDLCKYATHTIHTSTPPKLARIARRFSHSLKEDKTIFLFLMFYKNSDGLAAFLAEHFLYPGVLNEQYYNGVITA